MSLAAADKKKSKVSSNESLNDAEFPYDYLSFAEMRNVIDLLVLYTNVN